MLLIMAELWHYYLIAVFLTLFLIFDTTMFNVDMRRLYYFFIFFVLTLFAGLRGLNSIDYVNYDGMFVKVYDFTDFIIHGGNSATIQKDVLYLFLNTIVKSFFTNSMPVFVLTAALAVGINIFCFARMAPFPILAILWYYCHLYLNKEMIQIRAGIGSAFVLLSVLYIARKRFLPYLITMICAGFLHAGAFVALPMYFICRLNPSRKTLFAVVVFGILLGASGWLDPFLGFLKAFDALPSRVADYQNSSEHGADLGLFNPMTLKQIFVCCIAIYYKDKFTKVSPYFYPLLVFYVASTFWITAFQGFAILAARVATFLSAGDPIITTYLVLLIKERRFTIISATAAAWGVLYLNINILKRCPFYTTVFDYW